MSETSYFVLKFVFAFIVLYFTTCKAEDDRDKLWILFDHTNLFECQGGKRTDTDG